MKRIFMALTVLVAFAQSPTPFIERADVQAFISEVAKKNNLPEKDIRALLAQANPEPKVVSNITRPYEAQPWHVYRTLITDQRVAQGAALWKEHEKSLKRAEEKFGVPPEIILAIIGIESWYGKYKGTFRVLDSLTTLSFEYPARSAFFKSELEHFILLCLEEKWDPTQIKGSYAGAMGIPQFISSSYRNYAVDFSGTGKRDLIGDLEDAIGSVGNYFQKNGWQKGAPIVTKAAIAGSAYKKETWSTANPKPRFTQKEFANLGVKAKMGPSELGHLLEFQNVKGPEYWVGLNNFYTITRYNRSHHYAMAVVELSARIKKLRKAELASTKQNTVVKKL